MATFRSASSILLPIPSARNPQQAGPCSCGIMAAGWSWVAWRPRTPSAPACAVRRAVWLWPLIIGWHRSTSTLQGETTPGQVCDCQYVAWAFLMRLAFNYIYRHAAELDIDISRLGIGGSSSGANLAMMISHKAGLEGMKIDFVSPVRNSCGRETLMARWFWASRCVITPPLGQSTSRGP